MTASSHQEPASAGEKIKLSRSVEILNYLSEYRSN
jgi:hypothetical protein